MRRFALGVVSTCVAVLSLSALPLGAREDEAREPGDRPAERAEWNAALRLDREGRLLPENRLKALRQACEMPVDPSMAAPPAGTFLRSDVGPSAPASATFGGTSWQSLGPMPMTSYTSNPNRQYGNVGGRVDAIAIHPTNPSIILLGSATGGIWKSTDAGQMWRPVSDYAPSLATSAIAFAPSNPSIVYAATGEVDSGSSTPSRSLGTYLGDGLLKSFDGGETWMRVDTNLPANAILSRVVVDPRNPSNVLVGIDTYQNIAANALYVGGIYRSTDGGVTFSRSGYPGNSIADLLPDPNDPARVYLATGGCNGCADYGVFVSTDFGSSWSATSVSSSSAIGRIKLGASRTNPTVLYASVLASDNTHTGPSLAGIWVSQDAGATWTKKNVNDGMCPTTAAKLGANQCSYDHFVSPDPANPAIAYFGSVSLYKTTDFGATWVKQVDVYPASGVATLHPDQHAGVFGASGELLIANDGGVYRTYDGANTFENLNATLNVSQFQRLALHPTNPEFAMGGTQDNGSQRYTGSLVWADRIQGDGGFVFIRKDSPSQVLAAHYRAWLAFSNDGTASFYSATDCQGLMDCTNDAGKDTMAFYPPAAVMPAAPGTVLLGTNRVWFNESFGAFSDRWHPLTSTAITTASGDYLTAVEASSDLNGAVWAGTRQGYVFLSPPGDPTFHSVGGSLPGAIVTGIVSLSADGQSVYVTFGGYLGLPSKHVFLTTNGGTSWTNVSSNLPDVPVLALAVDPGDPTDLFVGTDVGVFRSVNGGASWTSFNAGLPNVPVYDLKFHAVTRDLWAATYGRGVWRVKAAGVWPGGGDFNGDGQAEVAVFRPGSGVWYALGPSGSWTATPWGVSSDLPVPADYDGDGVTNVAVYRPSTGVWYVRGASGGYSATTWGQSSDIPVPGDFDGDGKADPAVYRPGTGAWFVAKSTGGTLSRTWGTSGDVPVSGDFDGDGKADFAVVRKAGGVLTWYVLKSGSGYATYDFVQWGVDGDVPAPANYDGDGKTDIAVFRPSTGWWYVKRSSDGGVTARLWGVSGDVPQPADYDGDGKADIAVYRPGNGTWYIVRSSSGAAASGTWGVSGDVPVTAPRY